MVTDTAIMEEGITTAIGGHTLTITPIRGMDTVGDITTTDITALVQTEPDALTEEEMTLTDPRPHMIAAL